MGSSGAPVSDPGRGPRLSLLFHRRWAVPILAELERGRGAKLVTLVNRLDASPGSIRAALDHLQQLDLVIPNPGYGHPMRPEYILTPAGQRLAAPSAALDIVLARRGLREVGLRKWSMPTLDILRAGPARFGQIRSGLAGATDRALSLALGDLQTESLVTRTMPGRSPGAAYAPTPRAARLCAILGEF